MTFACWKCVERDVPAPGEMCHTCLESEDRKGRRRASAAALDRDEEISDRSYYRNTVSASWKEPDPVRFHSDDDLPPANAKPSDWVRFHARHAK